MFRALASHNDDLDRLEKRGYAIATDSNYIVVRDIFYLDADLNLREGAIVTKFVDRGENRIQQEDHQVFFAGGTPYGLDGKPIPNLADRATTLPLAAHCADVVVERAFSNKPTDTGSFKDFFHKIESYTAIINSPARAKYGADATPYTFRKIEEADAPSVFKIRDTLTSRAEISDLAAGFKDDVIAIVGLGGTGSYLLDLIAKTPVREIRGFDPDLFYGHNAFRSPGRLDPAECGRHKADVYRDRYEPFRDNLIIERKFIDATSTTEIDGVTFAFVCVDKGSARAGIFDLLIAKKIPFIDVGIGLQRDQGLLNGMIRTTYFSADDAQAIREQGFAELADHPDDEYRVNVQTAELNALNAAFAVMMFKQIRGFYRNERSAFHRAIPVSKLKVYDNAQAPKD